MNNKINEMIASIDKNESKSRTSCLEVIDSVYRYTDNAYELQFQKLAKFLIDRAIDSNLYLSCLPAHSYVGKFDGMSTMLTLIHSDIVDDGEYTFVTIKDEDGSFWQEPLMINNEIQYNETEEEWFNKNVFTDFKLSLFRFMLHEDRPESATPYNTEGFECEGYYDVDRFISDLKEYDKQCIEVDIKNKEWDND